MALGSLSRASRLLVSRSRPIFSSKVPMKLTVCSPVVRIDKTALQVKNHLELLHNKRLINFENESSLIELPYLISVDIFLNNNDTKPLFRCDTTPSVTKEEFLNIMWLFYENQLPESLQKSLQHVLTINPVLFMSLLPLPNSVDKTVSVAFSKTMIGFHTHKSVAGETIRFLTREVNPKHVFIDNSA